MKRPPASIHIFPIALITLGIIACVASALLTGAGGGFVGLLLLISITALLAGGLLGFLFGIPKVNRQYAPGDDYAKSRKYFPNTNLEEVSDWLTKIIIGVGLTQLIRIPEYLRNLATGILNHMECPQLNGNAAHPILVAVILYFLIAGFIVGYFYTRLYLANLWELVEESRVMDAEIAIWRAGAKSDATRSKEEPSLTTEERQLLQRIADEGEQFPSIDTLKPSERAAVNTLTAKGIIEYDSDRSQGKKVVPRAINPK
ncbi:MAG: hypothetical protein ACOX19_01975 [Fermentimonas sp.]|jgi:hypothetical protein